MNPAHPGKLARRLLAAAFLLVLGGCAWLGPEILRTGRPAYNDAILASSDEQLLQNIIRLRFGDSIGFLAVSSVTANVSVSVGATVNAGAGPASNYAGNLVPFAGTVAAEQNPTISYVPVSGETLLRKIYAAIPLDRVILAISGAHDPSMAWYGLVRRINNFHNPEFPDTTALGVDPRFAEIVDLAVALQARGMLYWVRLDEAGQGRAIILHSYAPHHAGDVARMLDLLEVSLPARVGGDVLIPVQFTAGARERNTVSVETRSLHDLMRVAAASVEVAPGNADGTGLPRPGRVGAGLRIRVAGEHPSHVRVAARYRERWYFIADDDGPSKRWFSALQLLVGAQLAESGSAAAPLLMIPVAGRR